MSVSWHGPYIPVQSLLRRKSSSTKTREDKTINIESKIVAERSAAEPLIVTQETGTQVMNFLNEPKLFGYLRESK